MLPMTIRFPAKVLEMASVYQARGLDGSRKRVRSITAGTLLKRLLAIVDTPVSMGRFPRSIPSFPRKEITATGILTVSIPRITTKRAQKSVMRCQSTSSSIRRDIILRLQSSTPAIASAVSSRGRAVKKRITIRAVAASPFVLSQRSNSGQGDSSTPPAQETGGWEKSFRHIRQIRR